MVNDQKLTGRATSRQSHFSIPRQLLPDSEIHIWRAPLERHPLELEGLFTLLAQDEKARAERFYFEKDCKRYIAGRGILRIILGSYLEMEPSRIEFTYGNHGKPAVNSMQQDKVLEFNLSHSNDLALYIIGGNRRVGIDVEYVRRMPDMNNFAEQFFSPGESAFVNSLPGKQKDDAFFKLWTCKEAFLKANGSGLTVPIRDVEVALEGEESVLLTSIGGDDAQARHWHLEAFHPVPEYQAAIVVEGQPGKIVFQQFPVQFRVENHDSRAAT